MTETILSIVLFLLAFLSFILSGRAFLQKGFLLNNAYLYASKKERETMDKAPYYHQTAIVFLLIGIIFLLNAFSLLLSIRWISYIVIVVVFITLIYAISSSIKIEKRKKQR